MSDLALFMAAMDGEWVTERYSLEADDKLRVHYRSCNNPNVEWSHKPIGNDLANVPPVGSKGRIAFVWNRDMVAAWRKEED